MSVASEAETCQTTISARSASEIVSRGDAVLIDVRMPAEFRDVHAEVATNCPLDQLAPEIIAEANPSGKQILLICKSGSRSQQALSQLQKSGMSNVMSVEGGTDSWVSEGLPVVRGRKSIALDRQVRIAAGSLVLLGVLVGYWHPIGYALSAFIGAGLVFSGLTDTCGMGMALAKMPWNR